MIQKPGMRPVFSMQINSTLRYWQDFHFSPKIILNSKNHSQIWGQVTWTSSFLHLVFASDIRDLVTILREGLSQSRTQIKAPRSSQIGNVSHQSAFSTGKLHTKSQERKVIGISQLSCHNTSFQSLKFHSNSNPCTFCPIQACTSRFKISRADLGIQKASQKKKSYIVNGKIFILLWLKSKGRWD